MMDFRFHSSDTPERGLWCPSSAVAHAFKGYSVVCSGVFDTRSGVGDIVDGECAIDFRTFSEFSAELIARYCATDQGILRSLTVGFIATSLVLIDRAGLPGPLVPGEGQQQAWAALRDQHARAMPV
ncbi:DUF6086 family protein [Streptomyces sp. NPDC090053]|uniref:DUF6086 family protein n=1 Tax=Streptomyces sp. NPDC090053 TaxID=3365932 RepID=UPI003819683D